MGRRPLTWRKRCRRLLRVYSCYSTVQCSNRLCHGRGLLSDCCSQVAALASTMQGVAVVQSVDARDQPGAPKDLHSLPVVLFQPIEHPFLACRPVGCSPLHQDWQALLCCALPIHDGLQPAAGLLLLLPLAPVHRADWPCNPAPDTRRLKNSR